ncbi:MAG: type II toxin-antitoxin system VapB family antitoxin [Verrucomicrobiota bacterium]
MRTNVVIDEDLIEKARSVSGLQTKRDIIDFALRELIRRSEIQKLRELRGTIEWEGDLSDMRAARDL